MRQNKLRGSCELLLAREGASSDYEIVALARLAACNYYTTCIVTLKTMSWLNMFF